MVTKSIGCPSCDAKLKIAATLPAGKKIKCPKCETAFAIPDDEEEVEDRPARRPRRKPKKASSNVGMIVGLSVGALVLLGGGVLGVVFMTGKPKPKAAAMDPSMMAKPPGVGQFAPPPQDGQPANPGDSSPASAGRKVFEAHNCGKCHSTGGGGGGGPKGKRGGPDLSGVGASHDAGWIADHVRAPTSHNPRSKMPPYEGKISPEDLRALSEYLASLK